MDSKLEEVSYNVFDVLSVSDKEVIMCTNQIKIKINPTTLTDLVKINGFLKGRDILENNAEKLVEQGFLLQVIPSEREDVFCILLNLA